MAFDLGKLKSLINSNITHVGENQMIGIDVGASTLKIVQFHKENNTPTLDTYGELQLGPYANVEIGQIAYLPEARLTEALVDIIRESSASANTAALSISYASSLATTVVIDSLDEAEIAQRIPVEARKYIPVSLTEVTLDWFPLSQDEAAGKTTLLLIAIFNDALERVRGVLTGAGLTTSYTELEPFSAVRSSISQSDVDVAIIDFGAASTKLYIVHNGIVEKMHKLSPAGSELTNIFKKNANITFAEAENLKREIGITEGGEHDVAVREVRAMLTRGLRELDKVIDTYEVANGRKVDRTLFLGGGALTKGLVPFAQDILQRTVTIADPFSKVAYPAFLEDTLREAGPSFGTAIGAALRAFID